MRAPGKGVGSWIIRVVLLGVLLAGVAAAPAQLPDPQVRIEKEWKVTTLPGHIHRQISFHEKDRLLLDLGVGASQLWDTRTGRRVAVLDENFDFAVLTRDGKRLIVGASLPPDFSFPGQKDRKPLIGSLQVRDLTTGKLQKSISLDLSAEHLRGSTDWRDVKWIDSDKLLLQTNFRAKSLGCPTGMVIVDIEAGRLVKISEPAGTCGEGLFLSPDGKRALRSRYQGAWRDEKGNPALSGVGTADRVELIDLVALKLIATLDSKEPEAADHADRRIIVNRVWSADSKWVATVSTDFLGTNPVVRTWDGETGKRLGTLLGHSELVFDVTFSSDGKRVVTASEDRTARIWDAATGEELLLLKGHTSGLNAADFDPQGRFVLTSAEDRTARLWDATTGKQVRVWADHEGAVRYASFSPDGKEVQTRTAGGVVRRWSLADGSLLEKRQEPNWSSDRYGALYLRDVGEKTEVWSGPPGAPGEKTSPEPGR
jgi:hypothetical protein